ncbi:prolyl oligopeptidase family serine peptidase [Leadbetterella byssophila]|uniref:S9 family peptidase n=1 Tax=Leadbetterella byssophila TaxID=316068 RepID=UPI00399F8D00
MKRSIYALLLFGSIVSYAQKKPLDHSVYDGWQSIGNTGVSKKGDKIFFQVTPQEGDGILYLKTDKNETLFTLPRASNPKFSSDDNHLVSLISPLYAETRKARIDKKKREDMPKDSLAIYSISTKNLTKIPQVKSYQLAEEDGKYLVYLYDELPEKKPAADTAKAKGPAPRPKKPSTNLVVYHLGVGKDTVFQQVESYDLDKKGRSLVFVRKPQEKDSVGKTGGVFRYDFATKTLTQITSGKGTFKGFTFDESSNNLAYLGDMSPEKAQIKDFKVYLHTGKDTSKVFVSAKTPGVPTNWYVSGDGNLKFSKNGEKLFLGLAPVPRVKDTTLVEFEHAKVDIWHWKDDYLQTQQLVNLRRDLSKSYLSVVNMKSPDKVIALGDEKLSDIRNTEDANNEFVVATTDFGRRIETQWQTGSVVDVYLVSTVDGSRKLIAEKVRGMVSFSPEGKNVIWYDRSKGHYFNYNIASGNTVNLTEKLGVSVADEDNDSPDDPNSYGIAGWTTGDEKVWINDRYDIWSIKADGTQATKITNGREQKITFRYEDWKERKSRFAPTVIDEKSPMVLTAFNNETKEAGFYSLTLQTGKKAPKEPFKALRWAKNSFSNIKEAKDAKVYVYVKERYEESPNVYLSKDLVNEVQLSDINLQQKDYNWGTAELYHWTTPTGKAATGVLYKPADFDPNKTYPIIAYFYEKVSDGLYKYNAPAPTPSRLNISFFVSNGYVVFTPDISYTIGYPGKSAEEYINSGMASLKQNKWAGKLAIQGQSWGGYQVAHLITVTDMYDAAWAGAPVVNMTSAYGGIRWGTGMNRQFQYERTQSRIGATLWEKPELYIENSPLFRMPNVKTPVVIMHNDQDGAVPWYQGIEMFTALRRLQKPVWMLNYNGDDHNLVQRQNRKDIQRRQLQFFDHFLKGKPAAPWIEKGVPATLKGIDWGFGDE